MVDERACWRAPRTTKLEHCTSYLNYSFMIKYLTTRRTTAHQHAALPRAMSKKRIQKLHIILEYSFTNTCSITSGATARRQDALPRAEFQKNKSFGSYFNSSFTSMCSMTSRAVAPQARNAPHVLYTWKTQVADHEVTPLSP